MSSLGGEVPCTWDIDASNPPVASSLPASTRIRTDNPPVAGPVLERQGYDYILHTILRMIIMLDNMISEFVLQFWPRGKLKLNSLQPHILQY